jgi:hypothetical protein
MKKILLLTFLAYTLNVFSQDDKTVTLVVSGQGKTQDEAKQNALRSAIEQAFGTFISSKTEILNDNLVKDEIVSISNGNIQKFDIISEVQIPNGGYISTLKTVVSVTSLAKFVKNKGKDIDFDGELFNFNINQQIINESNEIDALENLELSLNNVALNCFDFEVIANEPISKGGDNSMFIIPLKIICKGNSNLKNWLDVFNKTVRQIALKNNEKENYNKIKKNIYYYTFALKTKEGIMAQAYPDCLFIKNWESIPLRNKSSLEKINRIFKSLLKQISNVKVSNGKSSISPSLNKQLLRNYLTNEIIRKSDWTKECYYCWGLNCPMDGYGPYKFAPHVISIKDIENFVGNEVAIFEVEDNLNLIDLKNIKKYKIE